MTFHHILDRFLVPLQTRRFLNETVMDWTHEVRAASSFSDVAVANWRGVASLMRVLPLVVAGSLMTAAQPAWLVRLYSCAAIAAACAHSVEAFCFFSLTLAIPLAVLFGPRDRVSILIGAVCLQLLATLPLATRLPLNGSLVLTGAILATAVADQLRVSRTRERHTLGFLFGFVTGWAALLALVAALRQRPIAPPVIDAAMWLYVVAAFSATWWWLVRSREQRTWWPHVRLWLQYRGGAD